MDVKSEYERQTGDYRPANQIGYSSWYQRYVTWLENEFIKNNRLY